MDRELKELIEKNRLTLIPQNILKRLRKLGIIIEDHVDERRILKCRYDFQKYNTTNYTAFTILTTYDCNLACPYCYEASGQILQDYMTDQTIDRVVKFVKKVMVKNRSGVLYIVLFGGEPLLNGRACFKLLNPLQSWAREKGIKLCVEISTNGTLFNKNLIRRFSAYDHVTTHIPLHGPKEIHDKKRPFKNGSGSFDVIINALKLLKKSNIKPYICVNIDEDNLDKMEDLLETLKEHELQDIPLDIECISYDKECLSPAFVSCQLSSNMAQSRLTVLSKLLPVVGKKGFRMQPQERSYVYCNEQCVNHYTIDPLCDVYKCWHAVGRKDLKVGIITKNAEFRPTYPYYDLLSRDPLDTGECRECILLPHCFGGCHNRALFKCGTFHAPGCYGDEKSKIERIIESYLVDEPLLLNNY